MHLSRAGNPDSRGRARATVDRVVDCIVRNYHPVRVILFGSYARGDIHEGSAVDLLIVKDTDERFTDRIGAVLRLCDFDVTVEPLVYTPAELQRMVERGNDFILTALREGRVVYERG